MLNTRCTTCTRTFFPFLEARRQLKDAVSPPMPRKTSVMCGATFAGRLDTARRIAPNTTPKRKQNHPKQQAEQIGRGPKWCSEHLTTSHSDDVSTLQKGRASNGYGDFTMFVDGYQQHQSTAPWEQGCQGEFWFRATTAMHEVKIIN